MIRYTIYILTLLVVSCVGGQSTTTSIEVPEKMPQFRYPDIPAMITDDGERLRYFTEHYWDNYDFANSLLIHNDSITGSAMAGYISLLDLNDTVTVTRSIERTLDRAVVANYDNFLDFILVVERYLHDPNSPVRNEELYIPVLQYIIGSEEIMPEDKLRSEGQLRMVLKNRVGECSTDFDYKLASGETCMLHDIEAKYIILFFNSPDCEECARVKHYMLESERILELVRSGELKILALYPDADIELWRNTEYHPMFINGYDDGQKITKNGLYDLNAIPILYLIDNQHNVILKDTTIEQIDKILSR